MKKVLVGGVFNIIHPGHMLFFREARKLGDYLVVVVASDKTATSTKIYKVLSAQERKKNLEKAGVADKVVVGDARNFFRVVKTERPDVIALGHDQNMEEAEIRKALALLGLNCKVVRIRKFLEGYSTSRMMKDKKQT
jgi:FAD synthetase